MSSLEDDLQAKPEETHPYCRWCGRYMGYPGVADHAQRHHDKCKIVQWRKANPATGEDSHMPSLGDRIN